MLSLEKVILKNSMINSTDIKIDGGKQCGKDLTSAIIDKKDFTPQPSITLQKSSSRRTLSEDTYQKEEEPFKNIKSNKKVSTNGLNEEERKNLQLIIHEASPKKEFVELIYLNSTKDLEDLLMKCFVPPYRQRDFRRPRSKFELPEVQMPIPAWKLQQAGQSEPPPKQSEPLPKQSEPSLKQSEPLPKQSEPSPKQLEPSPKHSEPSPKHSEFQGPKKPMRSLCLSQAALAHNDPHCKKKSSIRKRIWKDIKSFFCCFFPFKFCLSKKKAPKKCWESPIKKEIQPQKIKEINNELLPCKSESPLANGAKLQDIIPQVQEGAQNSENRHNEDKTFKPHIGLKEIEVGEEKDEHQLISELAGNLYVQARVCRAQKAFEEVTQTLIHTNDNFNHEMEQLLSKEFRYAEGKVFKQDMHEKLQHIRSKINFPDKILATFPRENPSKNETINFHRNMDGFKQCLQKVQKDMEPPKMNFKLVQDLELASIIQKLDMEITAELENTSFNSQKSELITYL